jgi:hypothetical protein
MGGKSDGDLLKVLAEVTICDIYNLEAVLYMNGVFEIIYRRKKLFVTP